MKDNEINWDKPLIDATNAYLDSQDFAEDFKGNEVNINDEDIWSFNGEYFNVNDADDFIEYLQLGPMEMLRQMGAI